MHGPGGRERKRGQLHGVTGCFALLSSLQGHLLCAITTNHFNPTRTLPSTAASSLVPLAVPAAVYNHLTMPQEVLSPLCRPRVQNSEYLEFLIFQRILLFSTAKSDVGIFQRISLKCCEKMLHSSYDLHTKYEQPIRTSANTITFSVCTLQTADFQRPNRMLEILNGFL